MYISDVLTNIFRLLHNLFHLKWLIFWNTGYITMATLVIRPRPANDLWDTGQWYWMGQHHWMSDDADGWLWAVVVRWPMSNVSIIARYPMLLTLWPLLRTVISGWPMLLGGQCWGSSWWWLTVRIVTMNGSHHETSTLVMADVYISETWMADLDNLGQ
jgi:hypothetical protein